MLKKKRVMDIQMGKFKKMVTRTVILKKQIIAMVKKIMDTPTAMIRNLTLSIN